MLDGVVVGLLVGGAEGAPVGRTFTRLNKVNICACVNAAEKIFTLSIVPCRNLLESR
jgi:hypothetical protein